MSTALMIVGSLLLVVMAVLLALWLQGQFMAAFAPFATILR